MATAVPMAVATTVVTRDELLFSLMFNIGQLSETGE